jgi:hypothetical protein
VSVDPATSVDSGLLALLYAIPNFHAYDPSVAATPNAVFIGNPAADETKKIISVPLAYVVFHSGIGSDFDERMGGQVGGRVVPFRITHVGATDEQVKWAWRKTRAALNRKRATVGDSSTGLIRYIEGDDEPRKEPTYTQPGGEPLFLAVDGYEVTNF